MKVFIKIYQVLLALAAIFLLFEHTFAIFGLTVDIISIWLIAFLSLLPFFSLIKKFKIGDFEAEIQSKEIQKIETEVKKIDQKPPKPILAPAQAYSEAEVNELKNYLFYLVDIDPVSAIARLRIALEDVLRKIYQSSNKEGSMYKVNSMGVIIRELSEQQSVDSKILANLKDITAICNRVIHGDKISTSEAEKIIKLGVIVISYLYGYHSGYLEHQ